MASETEIKNFNNEVEVFGKLNLDRFYRQEFGTKSMIRFKTEVLDLTSKINIAADLTKQISTDTLAKFTSNLRNICEQIDSYSKLSDNHYFAELENNTKAFERRYDIIESNWYHFDIAQMKSMGILDKDYLKQI